MSKRSFPKNVCQQHSCWYIYIKDVAIIAVYTCNAYWFMHSAEPENAMPLSASMPGVFQPRSSSHRLLPPWHLSFLKHRTLCLQSKKKHFVMSYLCPVRDSDEQATAYWFSGLTYSLRSPAPGAPATSTQSDIFLSKQSSFAHKPSFGRTRLSHSGRGTEYPSLSGVDGLCVSLFLFCFFNQTPNTKSCLLAPAACTVCYVCSTGTNLTSFSHR